MTYHLIILLLLPYFPPTLSQQITEATILIDGKKTIAETDDNFICATIDWWPHDKCDYNQCPWGYTSAMNLNLSHPLLSKAVQAFSGLRIRLGGSLQDQVLYGVPGLQSPCHPFWKRKDGLFGFSTGCLRLTRWDALNHFFQKTEAIVTFGLNALHGRKKSEHAAWVGPWDSSNAHDFIKYTISKGYSIDSWEFGNELSGIGVGAHVDAVRYSRDVITLNQMLNQLYKNSKSKPSIIAPGGFYDQEWFAKFLQVTGSGIVDALTHHIYNLGAGNDPNLVKKIMDPSYLSKVEDTFSGLQQTILQNGPWSSAWVGESGGAYNNGGHLVSDTFIDSFWYLDQLGLASTYDTKVYCRQTLVGGNYGLLNTTTFAPNPDYYSALLWHRLMGKKVLSVDNKSSPFLRSYAHCSKEGAGVTLLLINLSKETSFILDVENAMANNLLITDGLVYKDQSFMHSAKKMVSWIGSKASIRQLIREEYHLTPEDGFLQSQTVVLNGKRLKVSEEGDIPNLGPVLADADSPIYISPLSIAFIVFPYFDAPTCRN